MFGKHIVAMLEHQCWIVGAVITCVIFAEGSIIDFTSLGKVAGYERTWYVGHRGWCGNRLLAMFLLSSIAPHPTPFFEKPFVHSRLVSTMDGPKSAK